MVIGALPFWVSSTGSQLLSGRLPKYIQQLYVGLDKNFADHVDHSRGPEIGEHARKTRGPTFRSYYDIYNRRLDE